MAAAAAECSWNWPAPPGTCRGTERPGDSSPTKADRELESTKFKFREFVTTLKKCKFYKFNATFNYRKDG